MNEAALVIAMGIAMTVGSAKAEVPREISYGSRAGMAVTVTSARGIDTSSSMIVARLTEGNARDFCTKYVGDPSKTCVKKTIRESGLNPYIAADCPKGSFSTFYGGKYQFVGKHRKLSDEPFNMVQFDIVDLSTKVVLDGSGASGYSYVLEQFKALCPTKAE